MRENDRAVSPVVGVMLMLVVTIIIAAIVSAFAGGSVSGTSKTPQAVILGSYSITKGMTISHGGGDAIPLSTAVIYVRPSKAFGPDADKYSWKVDKTAIFLKTEEDQTFANSRAFRSGETAIISAANLTRVQQRPDGTSDATDDSFGFSNTKNIGLSFIIEFQDVSGRTIGQGTVPITG